MNQEVDVGLDDESVAKSDPLTTNHLIKQTVVHVSDECKHVGL